MSQVKSHSNLPKRATGTGARRSPLVPANPSEIPEERVDSGVLDIAQSSVLVFLAPSPQWAGVTSKLASAGFIVAPVANLAQAKAMPYPPRYALLDLELPGAVELLRRLSSAPNAVPVIAVVGGGLTDAQALQCGARATLRNPLDPEEVLELVEGFRASNAAYAQSMELFGRQRANTPAESMSRVAAAIVHEIRNPLSAAMLNVALLRDPASREGERPEERDEILTDIAEALQAIESVMVAVRGLAHGDVPELAPVNLVEAVRAALAVTPNERQVPIDFQGSATVVGMANRGLLVQVVTNLVANALEALRPFSDRRVLLRVYSTVSEARISVRDNGPGIPTELRRRIFEPFFTTKGSLGTGLGLAISQRAVLSMGGALTLSGEPPPGTCFRIRLRLG